jgi:hypothetical protein
VELLVLSYIDAATHHVGSTNDSLDIPMFGLCCKVREVDVGSGPIASLCCAGLWEDESAGYGTLRITSGPRSIRINKRDGFTSMPAKRLGTTPGFTLKVSQCNPAFSAI